MMFPNTFKLAQITKFKTCNAFNTRNAFNMNPMHTNKYSFNKISYGITKHHYCTKQQEQQQKLDSTSNITIFDKYPWTSQLISASTGFIAYSGVIALNNCLSNSGLVDIIAQIGCIYSFGHLVGLTNTNFRDFLNQTFLAVAALIAIILFAYCYELINPGTEDNKGKKGMSIKIISSKE